MPLLKEILPGIRAKHGTQVDVAKKLGIKSQLLGQYEKGKRNPKLGFYKKWKEVFSEDLQTLTEANVSREAKNGTHATESTDGNNNEMSDNTEKSLGELEVYRKVFEGKTEYLVIPRKVLEKTQLVSIDELNNKNRQIDLLIKILGVELSKVPGLQNDKKKT